MAEYNSAENAAEWDAKYRESDRMWSGNPNGALVDTVGELARGTALDVGCGEGADALWLAGQGWQVTAFDPSRVAIERAREHDTDNAVEWVVTDLESADFGGRTFDLVSAMYPVVRKDSGAVTELLSLVAPDGHLFFVHHVIDPEHAHDHPHFDANVMPEHMQKLLEEAGGQFELLVSEDRERHVASGRGSGHSTDRILLARRRAQ